MDDYKNYGDRDNSTVGAQFYSTCSASRQPGAVAHKDMEIVGHCSCGAPVYGFKTLAEGEQPRIIYSCFCWRKQGILGRMETK